MFGTMLVKLIHFFVYKHCKTISAWLSNNVNDFCKNQLFTLNKILYELVHFLFLSSATHATCNLRASRIHLAFRTF